MAKKKKRKQFRDFESSAWQDDFKEPYISLTRSMLTNEKWIKLSGSSQALYTHMKLWAYGKPCVEFSYTMALNIIGSRTTIKKSIDELVKSGFLEITRISKKPGVGTIYKFSSNWYKQQ